MTSGFDWWPGAVRRARRGEPDKDERLLGGDAWREFGEAVGRAGEIVLGPGAPKSPLDRVEGYLHLANLLRMGLGELVLPTDPDRTSFGWSDVASKWGLDCADGLYTQAAVRGGAAYRVRGHRGSAHFMGFQVMAGIRPAADRDADTLELERDGSFELTLAPEKCEGNWIPLPPEAGVVIVRQFFYDWDREVPARLSIERVGGGEPALPEPTVSPGTLARQLEALGRFLHANADYWAQVAIAKRDEHVNSFPADHGIGAISAASQSYQAFGIGYFSLAEDEALLVEVKPPRAKYWSLHLGNFWGQSLDFANFQSSLNGHQAVLDRDGCFRAVVARRDPGIANWLDPAGHREGTMIYRWNQADSAPIPNARVVRLTDLLGELPPETPRIDAAARRAAIERRRLHVRRRYARPL